MSAEALAVARKAKELIVEHGWVQGQSGSMKVGFCLFGAYCEAALQLDIQGNWRSYYDGEIIPAAGVGGEQLVPFNDDPDRTLPEIMAVMDRVITTLERQSP